VKNKPAGDADASGVAASRRALILEDLIVSNEQSPRVARRGFLARLSASAAGLATFAGAPRLRSELSALTLGTADPDAWIGRLRGTDRLVLHAHEHLLPAVVGARNMLENGRQIYGVAEQDNTIAIATHGPAIGGLLRDDVWQKFALGELYKVTDPRTGAPSVRNPFLEPQDGAPADATVQALMDRGVLFIVCNVAVRNLSKRVARGADPDAIHHELLSGLVRGAIVVPDVYIAISRAQKRGVSYIFID
jgi:intracellular sulfur oxidation DsrE/DsrF family protein